MALYDYSANQDEELSIRKNEKLTLLDSSKTWWRVQNTAGSMGYVPSNYCKKIDAPAAVPKPSFGGGMGMGAAQTKSSAVRSQPLEEKGMYQQVDMTFNKNRAGGATKTIAIVKYPYTATRDDELTLNRGDEVHILEKEGDGWWNGECNGSSGWFPSNYVEETTVPDTSIVESPPPSTSAEPEAPAQLSVICKVRALYAFQSGNQEELSFERGNLMDIIDQPENDPDWWEARKQDGSTGLVPRNYVEIVHDEPAAAPAHNVAPGAGRAMPGKATSGRTFEDKAWFHGKMSRSQCEVLLARGRDGDFLVRESESKVCLANLIVLCLMHIM